MRLVDFLDKGASVHPVDAPCLTMDGQSMSYADVQRLSWSVGRALARSGIRPGDKVAVLSGNDPVAFGSVFGISRAGAVWCPVNPRSEAAENRELLALLDCRCLIFAAAFAPLVAKIAPDLPELTTLVCLDGDSGGAGGAVARGRWRVGFGEWLAGVDDEPWQADPVDDVVMIAGTGGTTGRPKGVMLTGRNLETMAALTLMSYPFAGSPVYLALAPLTHAAGMLCFPIMALGGEIVIMPHADLAEFLALIGRHRVTHTFLPPTVIYSLLDHPALASADLGSLQCLWYGAAPMSAARLEQAIGVLGPVLGQLFGQTEAPMFISALAAQGPPARRRNAGDRAVHVGRPSHPADHRGDHGRGGRAAAAGGARRDRRPRPAGDGRATTRTRPPPPRRPGTAGITPATSATSTPTATCTSSTGSRT